MVKSRRSLWNRKPIRDTLRMERLIQWSNDAFAEKNCIHYLLRAVFVVEFLGQSTHSRMVTGAYPEFWRLICCLKITMRMFLIALLKLWLNKAKRVIIYPYAKLKERLSLKIPMDLGTILFKSPAAPKTTPRRETGTGKLLLGSIAGIILANSWIGKIPWSYHGQRSSHAH